MAGTASSLILSLFHLLQNYVSSSQGQSENHVISLQACQFLSSMDTQILIALIVIAGIQIALKGLASPHWEVRNAGGMCFSALTLRMLGFKNEGNRSSVTPSQLFQRFPELLPVLVHQLEAGMQKLVSTTALHPALFPILALLSRLRYNHVRL